MTNPLSAMPRLRELERSLLDPHNVHDKPFVFPGYDGVPFRGAVPTLKDNDPIQPDTSGRQVLIECLNLAEPEHQSRYQDICQLIGNGFAELSYEERQYDPDVKNWRVLIRWMLKYAYMPKR